MTNIRCKFSFPSQLLWINKKLTIKITVAGQVAQALHRLINRCEQQYLEFKNSPGYFCMNYYTAMMQSFEREKNRQAMMITVGVALAMLFTFILWKWPLPKLELPPQETLVEVALEDFPPTVRSGGGGGGGNKVQADQERGIAKASVATRCT